MQVQKSIFILSVCFLLACGSAAQGGYIDNGDGTITDTGTGLMWQKVAPPGVYTWEAALTYCENLILNNNGEWTSGTINGSGAKYDDWRLPTAKELASIVDTTRYSPAIDPTYFPGTVANETWSSTALASALDTAWYVNFNGGFTFTNLKIYSLYVRAVRLGQSESLDDLTLWPVPDTGQTTCSNGTVSITCPDPGGAFYGQDASYSINPPAYTKLAAGCTAPPDNAPTWAMVRDDVTGLVWEVKHFKDSVKNYADSNDADNTYTWYDNNSASNGGGPGTPGEGTDTMDFIRALNTENHGGFSDWRMPTEKELQSIVDYGRSNPSIDNNTYFPNTVASYYWTSITAPHPSSSNYAWYVVFNGGFVYYGYNFGYNKSYSFYARAVRGGQSGPLGKLVISKSGAGTGTVTSADSKIDCGSECSETYTSCAEVTLTAAAASGSTFAGWSGGGCSGTGQCAVTITDNVTVTATFDLIPSTTTTAAAVTTTTTTIGGASTTTTIGGTTTTTTVSGRPCPARKALGENNPNLDNLRALRDSTLAKTAVGRRITQIYYNNADSIDAALERSPALRAAARRVLEAIAPLVGTKEE